MNVQTKLNASGAVAPATGGPCRLCGEGLSHDLVDLGMSPLCESFLRADQLDGVEPFFPLHAYVCDNCFLVQLKEYVSPSDIFREYAYFSSYSTTWVDHARRYCEMIKSRLGLTGDSLVVELASNDGYLLQHFLPLGVPVLGIEPAENVAKSAVAKGVPTLTEFFGTRLAGQLAAEGRQADLIVGNNVLAQVPDLNDFVAGIAILLKPQGVATLEFPHVAKLIDENQFDTIYHEHFSYFSLITIVHLAAKHGLTVIDVEELSTPGGSLRVYLAHRDSAHMAGPAVDALIAREQDEGLLDVAAYQAFGEKVKRTKRELLQFLIDAKNAGKSICGYGAPGKGNTLLNYCGIGPDFLDFTVDRNPYKHGRFTPGTRIPVLPPDQVATDRPDYVLVLPWNLRTELTDQLSYVREWGGRLVFPIPTLEVV